MLRWMAVFLLASNAVVLTSQQQERIRHLEDSLLAPCCYSQSIAQHMSGAAAQMRDEVTSMVASGMTDQQIIARYKSIYGDQILIVPDGNTGKVLFAMPVLILLLALVILAIVLRSMLRRRGASAGPAALPTALQEQIERETGDSF